VAKKSVAKKSVAKKSVAKKSVAKKSVAKAAVAAKSASKKAPSEKKTAAEMKTGAAKKPTAKKPTAPAAAPAPAPPTPKRRASTPPPAVNEPLSFITFVATYPVGSTIEGEVVSFTSHGAMVDVALPGGGSLHCYIPLSAMGDPPPTKARQVLAKGSVRPFVLSSLDPPRRVAELSLPVPEVKKRRGTAKKAAKAR
jgi:transcriptional accessory protein Tex/SPT6